MVGLAFAYGSLVPAKGHKALHGSERRKGPSNEGGEGGASPRHREILPGLGSRRGKCIRCGGRLNKPEFKHEERPRVGMASRSVKSVPPMGAGVLGSDT